MSKTLRFAAFTAASYALVASAGTAYAAEKLVASAVAGDLVIDTNGLVVDLEFGAVSEPVTGIGLTALWTGIVADQVDGVRPWSIDMSIQATGPGGETLDWQGPIGGDVTIADYPFADTSGPQFSVPVDLSSGGTVSFSIDSGNPAPWVIGLDGAEFYLTTTVEDQSEVREGIADSEDQQWSRPFFIGGVSGLGPVSYDVIEFTVPVSGGYTFDSVVASGNNFTYIYKDSFDPAQPLENLLDYSLGNGFGPFDLPRGQSKIDALLLEGTTYYFVTSQWDRFTDAQPYTLTITGPALIEVAGSECPGDATGDDAVDLADLNLVLTNFGNTGESGDVTGDGQVDLADLNLVLANFGTGC
ncbi:MAG: hypothetical protein ACF8MJ_12565 [Phycisphaerales bacterium JB050]